jgi:hypothetical protein
MVVFQTLRVFAVTPLPEEKKNDDSTRAEKAEVGLSSKACHV